MPVDVVTGQFGTFAERQLYDAQLGVVLKQMNAPHLRQLEDAYETRVRPKLDALAVVGHWCDMRGEVEPVKFYANIMGDDAPSMIVLVYDNGRWRIGTDFNETDLVEFDLDSQSDEFVRRLLWQLPMLDFIANFARYCWREMLAPPKFA